MRTTYEPSLQNRPSGYESEKHAAKFLKSFLPDHHTIAVTKRGPLTFDLVTYPTNLSVKVPYGYQFQSNVIVSMSDYLMIFHRGKYYLTNSSGSDPLGLSDIGVSNVVVVPYLSKRAGGSHKDDKGNKLYRPSNLAFRFKPEKSTHYQELTDDVLRFMTDRMSLANTAVSFDVKVGKYSQFNGMSVTLYESGNFDLPKLDELRSSVEELLAPVRSEIGLYLKQLNQTCSSFNVLIDEQYCIQNGIVGVSHTLYNQTKFNLKLTDVSEGGIRLFQSLCKHPAQSNTVFEAIR